MIRQQRLPLSTAVAASCFDPALGRADARNEGGVAQRSSPSFRASTPDIGFKPKSNCRCTQRELKIAFLKIVICDKIVLLNFWSFVCEE